MLERHADFYASTALASESTSVEPHEPFSTSASALGDLRAEDAARLIAAASDIALIIDGAGVVEDVSCTNQDLLPAGMSGLVGKAWIDTVTIESKPKVKEMLAEAGAAAVPRWRELNHPTGDGASVPVRYSALKLGRSGRVIALGQDLRPMATMQQQLMDAQIAMEREYARIRHAETRYRLLFHLSSEAVLIVDARSEKVTDANPAAGVLLDSATDKLIGQSLADAIARESVDVIRGALAVARSVGRADDVEIVRAGVPGALVLSASLFRQETSALFLVRLVERQPGERIVINPSDVALISVIERFPDGFVIIDQSRRILTANAAFLDLVQLSSEAQAIDQPLDRWFERPGVDLNVLMANLKEHGLVRRFATVLRGEYSSTEEVDLTAVTVAQAGRTVYGIAVRPAARHAAVESDPKWPLPKTVEQLTDLIGHVALKDVVREATDVIERLCIEAALEITGDNRASAAQILGLSRQSLYAKLRRYGLVDPTADEA